MVVEVDLNLFIDSYKQILPCESDSYGESVRVLRVFSIVRPLSDKDNSIAGLAIPVIILSIDICKSSILFVY